MDQLLLLWWGSETRNAGYGCETRQGSGALRVKMLQDVQKSARSCMQQCVLWSTLEYGYVQYLSVTSEGTFSNTSMMNAGGFPAVVHALVFKSLVDDSTCVGKVTAARCYRKGVVVHGVSISTKHPNPFG